eukprot:GSChrysophyteH1.ASY1.ANO1.24.1 assembled CDS
MESREQNSEEEVNHELTEEEVIDEEYRAWVGNSILLYDYQKSYGLEWPSLTVQWLPGTHTVDNEPNYLLIADVSVPDENGNEIVDKTPSINYTHRILHDGEVNRARYMPQNSKIIATKSPSKTVFVYNYENHPEIPTSNKTQADHECHGHTAEGYGICWNPHKAGHLLSGSLDGGVCIWDLHGAAHDANPLLSFSNCHSNGVEDVDWHKHHEYLFATVGNDSSLVIYDVRKGSSGITQRIQNAHQGDIHALSFNSGNEEYLLATGGADSAVNLWDLRKMDQKIHGLEGHTKEVLQVSWSPYNEAILASCSSDRRVNIWDVTQIGKEQSPDEAENGPPELYFVHGGHRASVSDFSWNMNEGYEGFMASVAEGNVLQVWEFVSELAEADMDDDEVDAADDDIEEDEIDSERARKRQKQSFVE